MIAVLLVTLFAATQSATPAVTNTVSAAPAAFKPVAAKPICRTQTSTGSQFSKRVCHSAAEWHMIDGDNARNVEASLNARSNTTPNR